MGATYTEAMAAVIAAARTSTLGALNSGGGKGASALRSGAAGQAIGGVPPGTQYDDEGVPRVGFMRFGATPGFGENS